MSYKAVVKREINQFINQPLIIVLMVVLPIVLCLITTSIFKEGSPRNLPIAVLNQDNSELSRLLERNIQTLPSCNIEYRITDFEKGKDLFTRGKIYALVVIPKDFQSDIYRMKQPKLVMYYNNQMILIGGIISKDLTTVVQTMMVGIDAKTRAKKGLPMQVAVEKANLIVVDDHVRSNPYLNYQYFLSLIAFGHILQILILMVAMWAFGIEFKKGTTKKWLKSANDSIIVATLGKITPYFIVFSCDFAIIYFMYFVLFNSPFSGNFLMVVFSTLLFIFTVLSLGALFMSINGNFRYCLSNAAFYSAMGFAFAGVTYPVMAMPIFAKIYSASLPLTHYIKILLNQTMRDLPVVYDLQNIFALLCLLGLCFLTLPRLKKLANDESTWYQK